MARLPICLFLAREKAKWFRLRICYHFAFSQPGKKQLPFCFFPGQGKMKFLPTAWKQAAPVRLEPTTFCLMSLAPHPLGHSSLNKLLQAFQKQPGCPICVSGSNFQIAFSRAWKKQNWKSEPFCFFPAREKANWKSGPFCFLPAREKANWMSETFCFFPAWEKANWKSEPFAFSRPGKKQIGCLNHLAFTRPGKKQIGCLNHFAFPGPGRSKLEA